MCEHAHPASREGSRLFLMSREVAMTEFHQMRRQQTIRQAALMALFAFAFANIALTLETLARL
jgi:hypothetical protein